MSADLTVEALDVLDRLLEHATPAPWKLWGMQVLADLDGTSNVDTAIPVAATYYCDENGAPRTWDAMLLSQLRNLAPALIAAARAHLEAEATR